MYVPLSTPTISTVGTETEYATEFWLRVHSIRFNSDSVVIHPIERKNRTSVQRLTIRKYLHRQSWSVNDSQGNYFSLVTYWEAVCNVRVCYLCAISLCSGSKRDVDFFNIRAYFIDLWSKNIHSWMVHWLTNGLLGFVLFRQFVLTNQIKYQVCFRRNG